MKKLLLTALLLTACGGVEEHHHHPPRCAEGAVACQHRGAALTVGVVCQDGVWLDAVACGDFAPSLCSTSCAPPFAVCCQPTVLP